MTKFQNEIRYCFGAWAKSTKSYIRQPANARIRLPSSDVDFSVFARRISQAPHTAKSANSFLYPSPVALMATSNAFEMYCRKMLIAYH